MRFHRLGVSILLVSVASGAVILGATNRGLRGTQASGSNAGSTSSVATATAEHPRAFLLSIPAAAGDNSPQPTSFPVFRVTQGEWVTLKVDSVRPGSVHVHMLEKKIDLKPPGQVELTFQATDVGHFPIHMHDSAGAMEHLAMLEVDPR